MRHLAWQTIRHLLLFPAIFASFAVSWETHTRRPLKMMPQNQLEGLIKGFSPAGVTPFSSFTLTLTVEEVWNRAFYFKFDDGKPIEGFLDANSRPSVMVEGLPPGEKFVYVSWDKYTWAFVGTLKVMDADPSWGVVLFVVVAVFGGFVMRFVRQFYRRRNRKKRSDDGVQNTSMV